MIEVKFIQKKSLIMEFSISGHAYSAPKGNDLVCAAVSGIVFGILNSLDNKKNNRIVVKDNFVKISVLNLKDNKNQIILNVLKKSLITVEKENKRNIKILYNEV